MHRLAPKPFFASSRLCVNQTNAGPASVVWRHTGRLGMSSGEGRIAVVRHWPITVSLFTVLRIASVLVLAKKPLNREGDTLLHAYSRNVMFLRDKSGYVSCQRHPGLRQPNHRVLTQTPPRIAVRRALACRQHSTAAGVRWNSHHRRAGWRFRIATSRLLSWGQCPAG